MAEETFRGYRIATTRLRAWNYASQGWYFVTFCTKNRVCCLGDVETARWDVSRAGSIVSEEIVQTERLRPNVAIDSWIVMPNHVHMIIEIFAEDASALESAGQRKTIAGSIGQIINQLKGVTTRRIRAFDPAFLWQPRYHDHVIRDEESLNRLRRYIEENPARWSQDRESDEGIWM